ncbi:GtrA family protein [Candidatus Peregrinibacteria bacterium]|nr:GtrA family protein [Candidatus Peregrinibacteria bacterium]
MKHLLKNPKLRTHLSQGMKFVVAGGIGTSIDLLSLTFLVEVAGLDSRIALVASSLVGASFVFLANKFITFANREKQVGHQILKFAMVYGVAIALNAALSNALYYLGIHYFLAKFIAIAVIAVWNYALSHGFIFKKREKVEAAVF